MSIILYNIYILIKIIYIYITGARGDHPIGAGGVDGAFVDCKAGTSPHWRS
jgi:hypothetical protein